MAAEAAGAIRAHLRADNEDRAYRDVIQFNDDLAREHGAVRGAVVVAPPERTGDDRYDAILDLGPELRVTVAASTAQRV